MKRLKLSLLVSFSISMLTSIEVLPQEFIFKREIDTIPVFQNGIPISQPFAGGIDVGGESAPTFADIDNDGDFDLFIGRFSSNLVFYRNMGTSTNPSFVFVTDSLLSGTSSVTPVFADIDSDGDFDLFMGNSSGRMSFYRNTGTSTNPDFSLEQQNFVSVNVLDYSAPTFTDIDIDGDLDLFVGEGDDNGNSGGRMTFYRNLGTRANPNFVLETRNFASIDVNNSNYPTFADIDNDGDFDLLIGEIAGNINFYRNTGTSTNLLFVAETDSFASINVGNIGTPTLVDIDDDEDLDIFIGNSEGWLFFYRNFASDPRIAATPDGMAFSATEDGSNPPNQILQINNAGPGTLIWNASTDQSWLSVSPSSGSSSGDTNNLIVKVNIPGLLEGAYTANVTIVAQGVPNSPFIIPISLNVAAALSDLFTEIVNNPINDSGRSDACCWGDYDNDSDLDLFVANPGGINFLYENNGDGSFNKNTNGDIVNDSENSTACSWGDYDNDGDLDLFVTNRVENNSLYANNGDRTFTKILTGEIVNDGGRSESCSWIDFNNDGDLDMFVANSFRENNFLYSNNGDGTFQKITNLEIVSESSDQTQGCSWGDFDNDGDIDLFIASGGSNNFLFENNGDGTFAKIATGPVVNDGGLSHGGSWGDYDNDGNLDLFVTNSTGENNFLYKNNGDGTFSKITGGEIVNDGGTSYGSSWGDYDNDGDLDLFVANEIGATGAENNFFYENSGDGTFSKVTGSVIVNDSKESNGSSWGDYDNDGDLDLFVATTDDNNVLYQKNETSNNWINTHCVGVVSNKSAIGSKVRLKANINGISFWQMREISGQTGYLGQNSLNAEFGLGDAAIIDSIKVEWPSGIIQFLVNVPVNQFLTITEVIPENNIPVVTDDPIPDQTLTVNGPSFSRNLDALPRVFDDPDGDLLTYTVLSSDRIVAEATILGSTVRVTPFAVGVSAITITAKDGKGGSAVDTFYVNVILNQPPNVMHTPLTLVGAEQEIPIAVNIDDDFGIADAILSFRSGGESNFTTSGLSLIDSSYQGSIPAAQVTSRGIEYFIEVTDLGGLTARLPVADIFSIEVNTTDPGVIRDTSQPGGSEQTGYRLVSVPINLDDKAPQAVLEDDLGKYDITKWRFYEVQANQTKVEFPRTSPMAPGKGFWLIVREAGKRISSGAGTSNPTDSDFTINLHPQWNLIGNPFNFDIPVANLSLSNSQSVELRSYTGSWNDPVNNPVTTIQPFEGYAIFNSSGTNTTLSINPDLSGGSNTLVKQSSFQEDWSIQVVAQSQVAIDKDNFLGSSSVASISWDEFDRPEPPVIGEFVSVFFPHPEWSELSKNFCTDFRPEISDGQIWEFEVKTNIRDVVNLSFEGLEQVPDEYEVWLVDPVLRTSQNLRRNDGYSVAASVEHPKRLQVVIGRPDFVEERLFTTTNIPKSFELSQNFPNPFNPTTTIRYGLPKEENVTLIIYNILGEEVVTLVNDELKTAGFHAAVWDGRTRSGHPVASGIFIYRLKAGQWILTKKMLLVR